MIFQDIQYYLDIVEQWLSLNVIKIIIVIGVLIVGYIVYFILKREITYLKKREKLEETTAKNLNRFAKFIIFLIIFTAVVMQFAESVGIITALLTIMGGTIIGFAAINTLGNIIAGLIIMITKPFSIGDRIVYKGKMADVVDIELMYTVLIDLDGVEIHVPNQLLLSQELINYKKDGNIVRIGIVITPGFDIDQTVIEKVLISAAKNIPEVLNKPEPYVWINRFQNYAVEYELFSFIKDIKRLPLIQSNLHKEVLKSCKTNNIDISTPLLLRNIAQ